jgi:hypothetical protein
MVSPPVRALLHNQYGMTDHQPLVWIIDSEHWPRACLRAELIERGLDAVGYQDLEEPLALLLSPSSMKPQAIVLELRGQEEAAADSLVRLAGSGIPVLALGGALEFSDMSIGNPPWAAILRRPVTLGEVADQVQRLLPTPRAT